MAESHLAEVRAGYDAVAETYVRVVDTEVGVDAFETAMLDVFAAGVRADGGGRVADLGCGTGRIIRHLVSRGLQPTGIDLSPSMLERARDRHVGLRFLVGEFASLPFADGELDGALLWYSLIHTLPADRPAVLEEVARVLRPGARLVLAFQIGDDARVRHTDAYGHAGVAFDGIRMSVDALVAQLVDAGFEVTARARREAEGREPTPQGFVHARKG